MTLTQKKLRIFVILIGCKWNAIIPRGSLKGMGRGFVKV